MHYSKTFFKLSFNVFVVGTIVCLSFQNMYSKGNINKLTIDTIPIVEEQIDTIITFYPETMEEEIKIIKTTKSATSKEGIKKVNVSKKKLKEFDANIEYEEVIDTIITFNADTYEEQIKIVKTKRPKHQKVAPKKIIIKKKDK